MMSTSIRPPAEPRIRRLLIATSWIGLVVGIVVSVASVESDNRLLVLGAAMVAGVWVVVLSVIPPHLMARVFVIDALALCGAILVAASMTLTGGTSSGYLILSFMPTMVASSWNGLRSGLASAGLTGGLILAVAISSADDLTVASGVAVLYTIVGATVAQIQRLLRDAENRATSLEEASIERNRRLEDLEQANQLLAQLADLAANNDLSPLELGRTALDSLAIRFPQASLTAAIVGENGPIVVARAGLAGATAHENRIDLHAGERVVGYVRIGTPVPLSEADLARAAGGLEPLALAFSNALLLQQLTSSAVKEERTRLARELHDEIGPTLSALGLSLDVALYQGSERRDLTDHLQELRQQVEEIVDEVRVTVSDLRSPRAGTLRSHLAGLAAQLGGDVDVSALDERRPARPSLGDAVAAICGEAVRNSLRHAEGRVLVKGWIDFDRGRVVVEDSGPGFDHSVLPRGHFGVIGMRERAEQAGIGLEIQSGSSGTRIVLSWGATK